VPPGASPLPPRASRQNGPRGEQEPEHGRRKPGQAVPRFPPRPDPEGGPNEPSGALVVSGGTVEKHVAAIFDKLGLPVSGDGNRRVLAVIRCLRS
jgi:hypothetical protein